MTLRLSLILLLMLTGCRDEENAQPYDAPDKTWRLVELNGKSFAANATLSFPEQGRVAGKAPCNAYNGSMSAPYPSFEVGPIAATKMACPDLAAESEFFAALDAARTAEGTDDTLILSNTDGLRMVFNAAD